MFEKLPAPGVSVSGAGFGTLHFPHLQMLYDTVSPESDPKVELSRQYPSARNVATAVEYSGTNIFRSPMPQSMLPTSLTSVVPSACMNVIATTCRPQAICVTARMKTAITIQTNRTRFLFISILLFSKLKFAYCKKE